MPSNEFAGAIRSAYPEYADRDNAELARAWVAKYPVYADRVDTAGLRQSQPSNQALNKGEQR